MLARTTPSALAVLLAASSALAACSPAAPRDQRMPATLVVTGGSVLTMDASRRVLSPGALAVGGAAILAVDTPEAIDARYRAAETIDASGLVVMPGLVNTHTHAPMVLYRGLADDLALMEWLERYIFPAEARTVSPEFVRAGTRLAALEMIRSGTTTFADMYYFEEEIARVVKEAGLRGVLGQTIIQFPVADAPTPADGLARAERFMQQFRGDELVVATVAPHSMYTLDALSLQATRALADRFGTPLLIHLAETEDEVNGALERHRQSPVGYLDGLGLWNGPALAAHGVWLSRDDMATLAARRVGVAHNPESNMKLGSGAAPVVTLREAGVAVGLGTDGAASNNDLDMFEAMRQAAFLQKLQRKDPRALTALQAIEMATRDGASTLGMADRIGSLEPGRLADLITVSLSAPRQVPLYDPVSHLVYVTRGDDVRDVVVNGRVLMRSGRVLTLDEAAVMAEARSWGERVRAAVQRP